jgi:hypothetical protein
MSNNLITDAIKLIEGTQIGKVIIDGLKQTVVDTVDETEKVATNLTKDVFKEAKEKIKKSMGGSDDEKCDDQSEDSK